MRILVTGASGFVGTHVLRHFLAAGHEIVGLTPDGFLPIEGAKGVRGDIRDFHVLSRHLETARPDAILHLAAIAYVPDAQRDPRGAFETNAGGTLNVLSAAAEHAPEARIVVVSSAEVYGQVTDEEEMPLAEDRPLAPVTLYGASKAAAEHLTRAYARSGLDAVVLRPFNHIGPGQSDQFMVPSFAHQIARLEKDGGGVLRHGNLGAVRDFLDVRDVVAAYEIALGTPPGRLRCGAAYNVCSGTGVMVSEIIERLVRRARCPIETEVDPDRLRPVDVPVFVGDPTRFREATGWSPARSLDDTIGDVLAEARAAV